MFVGIDAVTVWARTLTVDEDLNLELITNGKKKKLSLPLVVQVLPRAETGKHWGFLAATLAPSLDPTQSNKEESDGPRKGKEKLCNYYNLKKKKEDIKVLYTILWAELAGLSRWIWG